MQVGAVLTPSPPLRITLQVGVASTDPMGHGVLVAGWVVGVFVFHGTTYALC